MIVLRIAFFCLSIVSCGERFGSQAPDIIEDLDIVEDFTDESSSLDPFVISVVEGAEIGEYKVTIVPQDRNFNYSVIRHDFLKGETKEVALGVTGEFEDSEVISGEIYRYEIGEFVEDKSFQRIMDEEVKIPVDIKVEESQEINVSDFKTQLSTSGLEVLEVNRLSLAKNSVLYTEGKSLQIKLKKLFSFGGVIRTLRKDSKAQDGVPGISGGAIYLESQYANGQLHIDLRGQHGGNGLRPKPLGSSGKGKNSTEKGSLGAARREINQPLFGPAEVERESCTKSVGRGGVGGAGKKGRRGGIGASGGNTGQATIDVEAYDSFEVSYMFSPGAGGIGSIGGEGGPGGDGGPSGGEKVLEVVADEDSQGNQYFEFINDDPRICPRKPGNEGPKGPLGEDGENGANGRNEVICIKLGDSKTSCFKENI